MAFVELREAEVTRIINGYGVEVAESWTGKTGDTFRSYYTVWTQENLNVGDVINVKGVLSVKLDQYESKGETKHKAVANINSAKIQKADLEF
jgi:hypothetical protein